MTYLREIFDDWLTRSAGILLLLTIFVVAFSMATGILQNNPLIGVFTFSLVPVLFVVGGVIFILAILRS